MDPKADPHRLPTTCFIFATGPLTGTMSSTSGRYAVVTKGPLTNAIACSNSGGKFGAELKFAGYDMLHHSRASRPSPCYLHIVDDNVEILPADDIWGKTRCGTPRTAIRAHHQNPLHQGGLDRHRRRERRASSPAWSTTYHRAAGRSGVGARSWARRT